MDVASADDDFSFAYVVGERQGGETVDCGSWTEQRGDGKPAKPAFFHEADPYLRPGGRGRDPLLGEEGFSILRRAQPEQRGGRDAAAAWAPSGAGVVSDSTKGEEAKRPEVKRMPAPKGSLLLSMAKCKLRETQAVASRTVPKATVSKATVPKATVSKATVPKATVSKATVPRATASKSKPKPASGSTSATSQGDVWVSLLHRLCRRRWC